VPPASLTFSVAYARRDASSNDSLNVYVTTNCGDTWVRHYSKTGTALATAPDHLNNYTPTASEWRSEFIDLSSYIGQPNVQVRFEFYGNTGNNIQVDDINIFDATTGIDEHGAGAVSVFPNPSSGSVHFNLPAVLENSSIRIYSALGSLAKEIAIDQTSLDIDIRDLPSGIYFYQVTGAKTIMGKLVKSAR
jgi:hypothetical protein